MVLLYQVLCQFTPKTTQAPGDGVAEEDCLDEEAAEVRAELDDLLRDEDLL